MMKKTCETCKHRGELINTKKNLYWCESGKGCFKGSAWEEKGKESICRNCFHSYVCEQFNENKDDNNEKCHFANDHYIPRADVVPKSEVERLEQHVTRLVQEKDNLIKNYAECMKDYAREIFEEIERETKNHGITYTQRKIAELKKKYKEEKKDEN